MRLALDTNILAYAEGVGDETRCSGAINLIERLPPEEKGRIIHVHCSIDPIWIITAYDPTLSPEEWESDFKRRVIK